MDPHRLAVDEALRRRDRRRLSPLWRTWDALLCYGIDLDTLATDLRAADGLLPRLWQNGLQLAGQLPPAALSLLRHLPPPHLTALLSDDRF